jgi:hypothetical protein
MCFFKRFVWNLEHTIGSVVHTFQSQTHEHYCNSQNIFSPWPHPLKSVQYEGRRMDERTENPHLLIKRSFYNGTEHRSPRFVQTGRPHVQTCTLRRSRSGTVPDISTCMCKPWCQKHWKTRARHRAYSTGHKYVQAVVPKTLKDTCTTPSRLHGELKKSHSFTKLELLKFR